VVPVEARFWRLVDTLVGSWERMLGMAINHDGRAPDRLFYAFSMRGNPMTDTSSGIQVGQIVPDFKLTTFDPKTNDFGEFSLAENTKAGKWSILFFYPADFTFV